MATFFRQFPEEENKKKEVNRSRKTCSHDYGSRGSRTKTDFLKQNQRAVGRRPSSASMAFLLHHCHKSWRWLVAYSDREWIAQVTQSKARDECNTATVIEACLLNTRSKMFRQHLKCSSTAPRRAGTNSGFFLVSFYSGSCLSLGHLVQRCLGQPVDLLAP